MKGANITEIPTERKRRSYESFVPAIDKFVPMYFNSSYVDCWSGACGKAVSKVKQTFVSDSSVESVIRDSCLGFNQL